MICCRFSIGQLFCRSPVSGLADFSFLQIVTQSHGLNCAEFATLNSIVDFSSRSTAQDARLSNLNILYFFTVIVYSRHYTLAPNIRFKNNMPQAAGQFPSSSSAHDFFHISTNLYVILYIICMAYFHQIFTCPSSISSPLEFRIY